MVGLLSGYFLSVHLRFEGVFKRPLAKIQRPLPERERE
jgi:hypothetical protein